MKEKSRIPREKFDGKEHDYWVYGYGAIIITDKEGFPETHISGHDLDELTDIINRAKWVRGVFTKSAETDLPPSSQKE